MGDLIDKYKSQQTLITSRYKNKVINKVTKNTNDKELLEFYSTRYEDVDVEKFLNTERKERFNGLLNLVNKDEFYIDIGCANGGHMEKLYKKGIKGIGLDVSIPNIIKGLESKPHLKFIHGFAENIPFNDEYFDIAILGDVVEHFRDQEYVISEILRVVKKGFVICFPNDTKITDEHVSPLTVKKYINLCKKFSLKYKFYSKNGKEINIKQLNKFYWVFSRAQKTKNTNKIVAKHIIKNLANTKDNSRVLKIDQWKQGEIHIRHHTEIDRFEATSLVIKGKNILEVACGNGDLSVYLAKKGYKVTGIDISKEGIIQSKRHSTSEGTENNTKFYVMDGTKTSFKKNSFDSIIFPEVFEHVSSTRKFINEAIRLLKPGGKIFISVPDSLEIQWPGHIRFFTENTLKSELEQYSNNILFHKMNYKKWLICTFTPTSKISNKLVNKHKIDIILPTYNRANKIKTAIQSIIDQTYPNWTLHIVNDGGEDISNIINEYKDKRIKYYRIKHVGKPGALNYGLKKSNNPYIAYMDDDDIVFPQHLELLLTASIQNKKDFIYSDTYLTKINETSNKQISKTIENDLDVNYEMLRFKNYINHKQILHTRKLYKKVGEYDEKLSVLIDWDYIKRLAKESEPYHIKIITGNHFLYFKKNQINSITGIRTQNPKKYGESLSIIFSKDVLSLIEIFDKYHELFQQKDQLQAEFNSIIQQKDQLQAELYKIQSSKTYKLWQKYNNFKKIIKK